MRRFSRFVPVTLVLATSTLAQPDPQLVVDLVDPSDAIAQPPPHIVAVDIAAHTFVTGDQWTAAGIRAVAFGGATFRYQTESEPNQPDYFCSPGTDNRFVTFYSCTPARDANSRYRRCCNASAGRYCPTGPMRVADASNLNMAFFSTPPMCCCKLCLAGPWWILRLALDVSALEPNLASGFVIARPGEEPSGFVPILLSVCPEGSEGWDGTVIATFDHPSVRGFDWGLYARLESSHSLPGDLDGDCDVDLPDLAALLGHFGTPSGGGATYEQGDIFGDGGVDLTDLTALLSSFGLTCP